MGAEIAAAPATDKAFRAASAGVPVIALEKEFSTQEAGEARIARENRSPSSIRLGSLSRSDHPAIHYICFTSRLMMPRWLTVKHGDCSKSQLQVKMSAIVGYGTLGSWLWRIGGAITGLLCGLLPSMLILTWVVVAQPGFEASAGSAGLAYLLAAPHGIGGTLARMICSRSKRIPYDFTVIQALSLIEGL